MLAQHARTHPAQHVRVQFPLFPHLQTLCLHLELRHIAIHLSHFTCLVTFVLLHAHSDFQRESFLSLQDHNSRSHSHSAVSLQLFLLGALLRVHACPYSQEIKFVLSLQDDTHTECHVISRSCPDLVCICVYPDILYHTERSHSHWKLSILLAWSNTVQLWYVHPHTQKQFPSTFDSTFQHQQSVVRPTSASISAGPTDACAREHIIRPSHVCVCSISA